MRRRAIGRGSPSRSFVGVRPGLDIVVKHFVECARQHQWRTQLFEEEPLLEFVGEENVGDA